MNIPIYRLLLLACLCFPVVKIAFACGTKLFQKNKEIMSLHIVYQGKPLKLRAFYDSGNFLRDEISGKGVIIAQWSRARHLFPGCKNPEDTKSAGCIPITYRTLNGDAVLYAFLPETMYIKSGRGHIPTEAVYIGLIDRTLDYYHNWDAILPHDFEGENHHETNYAPQAADCG